MFTCGDTRFRTHRLDEDAGICTDTYEMDLLTLPMGWRQIGTARYRFGLLLRAPVTISFRPLSDIDRKRLRFVS